MLDNVFTPEGIALTINHGFGLLGEDDPERTAQLTHATQLYHHHVEPLLRRLEELGPAQPVRSGYALVKGRPAQMAAQVAALDASSGFVEVILDAQLPAAQMDAIAGAFSAALEPKGVVAIIHTGDVELRPLAQAAVPRLTARLDEARKHLDAAFEAAVEWEPLCEQSPECKAIMASQDVLRLLNRETLVAGMGDVELLLDDAPEDTHDEAVAAALRLTSALEGVDAKMTVGRIIAEPGGPLRWVAGANGVYGHGDSPMDAVNDFINRVMDSIGRLAKVWAEFQLAQDVDAESLFRARRATDAESTEADNG